MLDETEDDFPTMIVLLTGQTNDGCSRTSYWEDECYATGGWEFIDGTPPQQDSKTLSDSNDGAMGLNRCWEALELASWGPAVSPLETEETFGDPAFQDWRPTGDGISAEESGEFHVADEDAQGYGASDREIASMESIMQRLHIARDLGKKMSVGDRRKLAADTISGVMKSM